MYNGTGSKNIRWSINITELAEVLTPELCMTLPAFHAFTGSDYSAAFLIKEKAKPLKLIEGNEKYIGALPHLR